MAQPVRYNFTVYALPEQQGRLGMPEVVKAKPPQPGLGDNLRPRPVKIALVDRRFEGSLSFVASRAHLGRLQGPERRVGSGSFRTLQGTLLEEGPLLRLWALRRWTTGLAQEHADLGVST